LHEAESPENVQSCFTLMKLLRPHLQEPEELVARWRRQQREQYHLLVVREDHKAPALAGYRYQENLLHGLHLYVDDLVTSDDARGEGYGSLLLTRLKSEARERGLSRLVLDAAIGNTLGHRFYFRNGFLAQGLHFWTELDEVSPVK
jgi:GNAT superfamily N-acetyltransferase